jgi:chromosome segregation ATPase
MDGEDLFSPGGSAEPIRRPLSPSPAIDFDSIDDVNALKALLKAREEKMRTLEKRIEIAQGAKTKLKERYSEKIDMLEQLVVSLRHKLQTKVDQVTKHGAAEDADMDGSAALGLQQDQKIAALQKQNEGLKEMVQVQKQQLAAAKAQVKASAAPGGGDVTVLVKMEEKVHELTAALQSRTRECKAQAQLLEQKEVKIVDLQTAIVAAENKSAAASPDASGLSRKVQMLNSELEEARNMGTELQKQRDRFSAEFESLQRVVEQQEHEKAQLQRESEERAAQLTALQKERQRQIAETEEMHRMLCELEDQRNSLATQADDLKSEMSESMSRSLNASLSAERDSKEVAVLRHETATLRKHLQATQQATQRTGDEKEDLQVRCRVKLGMQKTENAY